MKVGILGSGNVGQVLGRKLARIGHDVTLGTRSPDELDEVRGGATLRQWLQDVGGSARVATFEVAAAKGEVMINATAGNGSLEALRMAGEKNLKDKILIDVANPLDFSRGMQPTLTVCNTDSLGEQIQRAFPKTKVVKALNTVNVQLMIDPTRLAKGEHHLFLCGNDAAARDRVAGWIKEWFGWKHIIDLGDITGARGMEMILPMWIRLYGKLHTPMFNYRIVGV